MMLALENKYLGSWNIPREELWGSGQPLMRLLVHCTKDGYYCSWREMLCEQQRSRLQDQKLQL